MFYLYFTYWKTIFDHNKTLFRNEHNKYKQMKIECIQIYCKCMCYIELQRIEM